MRKRIFISLTAALMLLPIAAFAFNLFGKAESDKIKEVVDGAVSPYDSHTGAYGDRNNSGDSYINLMCINIGDVNDDMDNSMENLIAEDRAKTQGTYLGQVNFIKQSSSFSGKNGLVWGYHISKTEDVKALEKMQKLKRKKQLTDEEKKELEKLQKHCSPVITVSSSKGFKVPVYNGDELVDAGRKLLGTNDSKRFTILPGEEVKCAEKKFITEGPKYIWTSIALCISEDREDNANLFINNVGDFVARDKEDLKKLEQEIIRNLSHAAVRYGEENNIVLKEIWISTRLKWIPEGKVGCAISLVPYLTLAKNAVPEDGAQTLAEMSINEWEKEMGFSPLPEYKFMDTDLTPENISFSGERESVYTAKSTGGIKSEKSSARKDEWTPLQIGFFKDHFPPAEKYPNIYGVRLGLPITYDDGSCLYGIDLSAFFSATTLVKGLQFTVVGTQAKTIDGLQVSIANFAKENINGMQFGGVNYAENSRGFQLGLVNYSKKARGIQIGLVNIIENGWIPFIPILNLNF
ncbi:MAG: histidine decarboxylase, pyruvoyl type [Victivallales bacterium]|nr:histidine decarboxylase, pyruvoyl type [Victivallales bacterium]